MQDPSGLNKSPPVHVLQDPDTIEYDYTAQTEANQRDRSPLCYVRLKKEYSEKTARETSLIISKDILSIGSRKQICCIEQLLEAGGPRLVEDTLIKEVCTITGCPSQSIYL